MFFVDDDDEMTTPDFPSFCTLVSPTKTASRVGYLPLTPESPTKPDVLKETMLNLVKSNQALGHEWTIIAGNLFE